MLFSTTALNVPIAVLENSRACSLVAASYNKKLLLPSSSICYLKTDAAVFP